MTQQTSHGPDFDPFGDGDEALSFKDAPIGTTYTGTVATPTEFPVPCNNFDTGKPDYWPDGNPKVAAVFSADFDGIGRRAVWARKPSAMFNAVQAAQKASGLRVAPGMRVTITLSNIEAPKRAGASGQKIYAVHLAPGAPGGAGDPFAEQQQPAGSWTPPPAAYVPPVPQSQYAPPPAQATYAPPTGYGQQPPPAQVTYAAAPAAGIPWHARFASLGQTEQTWAVLPPEAQAAIAAAAPPY